MCHEGRETLTRRAALALLPWLFLAAAGPGCSPAGPTSHPAARTPGRLKKMRALRGTGDPRRPGKRSSAPARHDPQPRRPRFVLKGRSPENPASAPRV
jgi:hypothetical protein